MRRQCRRQEIGLKLLPKIDISIWRDYGDCECCGGYDLESATLIGPDGREFHYFHDGHLGGGWWSGNATSVILWAFQSLGLRIISQETEDQENSGYFPEEAMENDYSEGFRTGKHSDLFCGPLLPIHISFQTNVVTYNDEDWERKPRSYTYEIHEKAFWMTKDGVQKEFPMSEDQDMDPVLLEILKEYADVSFKDETAPYEPRHYYDDDDWEEYAESGGEPENALQVALKNSSEINQ